MPKLLALAFPLIGAVCSSLHLRERMQELALPVGGTVGAAAMVIETGQRVSWNGGERLPMQSVYKVPIAMAVLARVDRGELDLERKIRVEEKDLAPGHSPLRDKYPHGGVELTVRGLLRSMIVDSDNTACDVLLTVVPPGGVTRFLRASDAQEITVATSEKEMAAGGDEVQYRNWATADAMAGLLATLYRGRALSVESRELLLEWMTVTKPGEHRIKALLPSSARVAHKTGTSGASGGLTRATNDAGIARLPDGRHLAIVVFVSESRADEKLREGVIAKIARAAWDCWTGRK